MAKNPLSRLDARVLEGFRALGDLTGTTSDAMDECRIVGAVPGSVLRPTDPKARLVGQAITVFNQRREATSMQKSGLGEIEALPVSSDSVDVVVSNCVLNLVPDKQKAFAEIFRVLKPGGHFSISDIVLSGTLPDKIRNAAEMYAGCVSGAVPQSQYLGWIKEAGFSNVKVQQEKPIVLPDDILSQYLSAEEIAQFRNGGAGILSITVYAEKTKECCDKETCCK